MRAAIFESTVHLAGLRNMFFWSACRHANLKLTLEPETSWLRSRISYYNMASPVGVSAIVLAWEEVRWIKERGGNGELCLFRKREKGQEQDALGREDVLSNREILAPIIKYLGTLSHIYHISAILLSDNLINACIHVRV